MRSSTVLTMNETIYGVLPADTLLQHDGLSLLLGLRDGTFPEPPIMRTVGFTLSEIEPGRIVFSAEPQTRHYNPLGTVHGGFAMTLLDSALACAVLSTLAKGEVCTTLEIKVNLVRPLMKETGVVRAEGRILHRGRTLGTSEGDIKDAGGKLYAHATTTCVIFPARA